MKSAIKDLIRPMFHVLPEFVQESVRRTLAPMATPPTQPPPNQSLSSVAATTVARAFADANLAFLEPKGFYDLLHYLRGGELEKLPQGVDCFISVGCAGTWYFNWVRDKCSPLRHVGIEYYAPKPDDLPKDVEWIANTAGDMSSIASGVGDVLFSGQNIEHLWPHDISAFLLESHRVLKTGGLLVVDSPNRLITGPQSWHHTEHILELTPEEAVELTTTSGFDVQFVRGMWLCSDSRTGTTRPVEEISTNDPWSLSRRIRDAASAPDQSFVWWLVASKSSRSPQRDRVVELVNEAFSIAWPQRVNRLRLSVSDPITIDDEPWLKSRAMPGAVMYGPYIPLPKGSYSITFDLRLLEKLDKDEAFVLFDVIAGARTFATQTVITSDVRGTELQVELSFKLEDTTFAMEFRVISLGSRTFACRRGIAVLCHSDATYSVARMRSAPAFPSA